ncbi:MAG: AraC family transcriptional regulator [Pseudomonadota bacterium]
MSAQYEKRLLRVLDYVFDNPAGDMSLDTLAEVAAMSRFHWHRVFHAMTGETCAQAVRRVRLQRASDWLVKTDLPLRDVAKRCGYPNQQSFTRIFSEAYGVTPGAFRKRGEARPFLQKPTKGQSTMFPVDVETHPQRSLAALAHQGSYSEVDGTFEKLSALFTTRDLWQSARGMLGIYYDDPDAVAEADLRSHAAIVLDAPMSVDAPLEAMELPGGRYAVMHYKGPYSGLLAAYRYLYGEWLPGSGEELGDRPPIEIYLNHPNEVEPDALLTDVCVPLK